MTTTTSAKRECAFCSYLLPAQGDCPGCGLDPASGFPAFYKALTGIMRDARSAIAASDAPYGARLGPSAYHDLLEPAAAKAFGQPEASHAVFAVVHAAAECSYHACDCGPADVTCRHVATHDKPNPYDSACADLMGGESFTPPAELLDHALRNPRRWRLAELPFLQHLQPGGQAAEAAPASPEPPVSAERVRTALEILAGKARRHPECDTVETEVEDSHSPTAGTRTFTIHCRFDKNGREVFVNPHRFESDYDWPELVGHDVLDAMIRDAAADCGLAVEGSLRTVAWPSEKGWIDLGLQIVYATPGP